MGLWEGARNVAKGIGGIVGGIIGGAAGDVTGGIVGIVGKLADKVSMDAKDKAALVLAAAEMDVAEFRDIRADIRRSGWLSRQVRPVISLSFHGIFMYSFIFDTPEVFRTKMTVVICRIYGISVTIGTAYLLILLTYFGAKWTKDFFIAKRG